MKIVGISNYHNTIQRLSATAASSEIPSSPKIKLNREVSDDTKKTDFTSMTRSEMRKWANAQLRSGEMSLDDSRPFMAMTMKIPVAGRGKEPALESDDLHYDFVSIVQNGIASARERNDNVTMKMLDSALSTMQRNQERTIGIDARV